MADANTTTTLPQTQPTPESVLTLSENAYSLADALVRHFRKKAHELDRQIQTLESTRDYLLEKANFIGNFGEQLAMAVMPLNPKCSDEYPEEAALLQEFVREWPGLDSDKDWLQEYDTLDSVEEMRKHAARPDKK